MTTEKSKTGWAKWVLATLIAIIGAGGGLVAILKYVDEKKRVEQLQYDQAMAKWEAFSPASLSLTPQEVDVKVGKCVDLNLGEIVSFAAKERDLCFHRWPDKGIFALSTQENITAAELGVVDLAEIHYRTLKDASFASVDKYQNQLPVLFVSKKADRPRPGFAYVLKIPTRYVAKVQIVRYGERGLENTPSVQWPYVRIRYEIFPIVALPSRPNRP